jgi:hypothetical protein
MLGPRGIYTRIITELGRSYCRTCSVEFVKMYDEVLFSIYTEETESIKVHVGLASVINRDWTYM